MDYKRASDDSPTMDLLVDEYIKSEPKCPADGTYTIGDMKTSPTCSFGVEHKLH